MLQNKSIKTFMEELASSSPTPGGGGAAALTAALASALGSMVFNLTVGKKVYDDYNDELKTEILSSLETLNSYTDEFINLMEKDAEAFGEFMSAFKLPKNTEEEKNHRQKKIDEGYIKALEVPLNLAEKAFAIYKSIEFSAKYGNKNVISDSGVAALLLQASLESAVLNVKINLSGIKDEKYKKNLQERCKYLIEEGIKLRDNIMKIVESKL
ncbi:cyclodeaminase/cyclohydrolase family protein [Clostridium sp. SYSU_GA19001]|uniref:cyclodeaminase/cyclohydrolase family protein n=1 Tax=Clostridium caldaquaticum TaxID=2940653 RepID=UPI00207727D6|nr:cyclodeaminase/cyclohydrolase family protein [Clostridium caldaquaticum]MCM8711291.1 cyclodeaminase/cyclohydrolase family protein [Clostridium caldaquaticum]